MSETNTVSPLRQHMIEDVAARKLNPHTQRSYIYSCKRSLPASAQLPATSCIGAFRTPAATARG